MIRPIVLSLFFLISTSHSFAQDNPVVKRIQAFTAAYNAGDSAAIAEFYTDDGALLPPRSNIIVGRKAIAKYYASAFNNGVSNLKIKVLELRTHGAGSAVEISDMTFKVNNKTLGGRYLHIWVRQQGNWYISRDMYNLR